jgi:Prp8 binding protein
MTFEHQYQILAVTFDESSDRVFAGTLDNQILALDVRNNALETISSEYMSPNHRDCVTGLALSPSGRYLVSNSMDQTLRVWDVRPFCEGSRLMQELKGSSHNFEKNLHRVAWSPDEVYVAAGGSDRAVSIWDVESRELACRLPGHTGSVNSVAFHPKERYMIASASSDQTVLLGDLMG